MRIAILLYEGFTALDAVGPYEVLRFLPGAEIQFVARERGLVRADSRALTLLAEYALEEVPQAEILILPGAPTTGQVMADAAVLEWVRQIHAHSRWTASVCDGSGILYAAGLLEGVRCTAHWASVPWLQARGIPAVRERVVQSGKILTAAGVSAGIDMALELARQVAGERTAQAIQLAIEYDPQPPLDSGSPEKASAEVVEQARALLMENMARAKR